MLQKQPLQTRNLKIEQRSEQPAEFEDRNGNQNLPIQDNADVSISRPLIEESTALNTSSDDMKINTDFLQELGELENLVLESVRVPLTELVLLDEGLFLEQIDLIRNKIPRELAIAINIIQRKDEILQKAKEYANKTLNSAQEQAERIIQKSALLRQAELEATRIKIEAERECEQLRQETRQEIQQWRELAIADYENIQNGADEYAKNVLGNLEGQLSQMLGIIRNGYQQLETQSEPNQ